MRVGDLVVLKEQYKIKGVDYGMGVIISMTDYPEEGFTSHKIIWSDTDFSFHAAHELEVISESR
tara:strand:- start:929 stop:1120 length:192 start_codon:yes stop_codon:yes gene_type:complete